MTTIKLYRDDSGIRQLQNQNETEPATEDVDQVRPYPEIKPMAPKQVDIPDRGRGERYRPYTDSPHTPKAQSRRGTERRQRQRRHRHESVMLDTRSRHERRTRLRRKLDKSPLSDHPADTAGNDMPPGIGIDRHI